MPAKGTLYENFLRSGTFIVASSRRLRRRRRRRRFRSYFNKRTEI